MKTIGLLTYHWVANFGANLQTFSTLNYIRKSGYEPIIINWIPEDTEKRYIRTTSQEQLSEHSKFHEKYGNISRVCRSTYDVIDVIKEHHIDVVIIGSDAVLTYMPKLDRIVLSKKRGIFWRRVETDRDFPIPYWGDFLNKINVPTALMSVSAQNTKYYHILFGKKKFAKLLNKMSYISVRDIWTQNMLQYLTNGNITATITPDPVFAFNYNISKEDVIREEQIKSKYSLPDKYALFSLFKPHFDNDWIKTLHGLFANEGIELIALPKANNTGYTIPLRKNIKMPIPPLDWYYLIKYSQGYIGELMHPIVVSLHNSVPIFSIDTYGWKHPILIGKFDSKTSKIIDIVTRFGFSDNIYNVNSSCKKPSPKYVYDKVLNFDRVKCQEFAELYYKQYLEMMTTIVNL